MSARKSERLLNLLIALLVSRGYVPKQRLREVIPDYRAASTEDAFDKMFERDKDDLRALGVPIEVGGYDPLFEDEPGYRIVRSTFELPDIDLEADEAAVVGLAARVWQHAGLASATSEAVRKLKAAGIEVDREALNIAQPQLAAEEPSFDIFWEGVSTRRPLTFDYRTTTAARASTRRLQPWGIVSYRSRWYVVGLDLDRGEERMFRLSRVVGTPSFLGRPESFTVPEDTDMRRLAGVLAPDPGEQHGSVRVRPGKAVALRHRAVRNDPGAAHGWDRVEVRYGRTAALVDELVSYGPDVVVEGPEELRAAVVARLRAAAGAA